MELSRSANENRLHETTDSIREVTLFPYVGRRQRVAIIADCRKTGPDHPCLTKSVNFYCRLQRRKLSELPAYKIVSGNRRWFNVKGRLQRHNSTQLDVELSSVELCRYKRALRVARQRQTIIRNRIFAERGCIVRLLLSCGDWLGVCHVRALCVNG